MRKLASVLLVSSLALPACVTTGTHKRQMAEAKAAHDAAMASEKKRESDLQKKFDDLTKDRDTLKTDKAALQKEIDITTATNAAMEDRLRQLGQNVKGLTAANKYAIAQLAELRRQKAAAEARLATFRKLVQKLQSMISTKELQVLPRNGRLIIAMPNDILFDSGSVKLKKAGQKTLAKVAEVLATIGDRNFLIAGHTDNIPIKSARFPSNWELSTERAVTVVRFLIKNGMQPKVLAAAGYGPYDPVAPNDNDRNRALNRRIEIVLQPNISELPSLEGLE